MPRCAGATYVGGGLVASPIPFNGVIVVGANNGCRLAVNGADGTIKRSRFFAYQPKLTCDDQLGIISSVTVADNGAGSAVGTLHSPEGDRYQVNGDDGATLSRTLVQVTRQTNPPGNDGFAWSESHVSERSGLRRCLEWRHAVRPGQGRRVRPPHRQCRLGAEDDCGRLRRCGGVDRPGRRQRGQRLGHDGVTDYSTKCGTGQHQPRIRAVQPHQAELRERHPARRGPGPHLEEVANFACVGQLAVERGHIQADSDALVFWG